MLNEDYRDMLQALATEKVEFLLVGAYALAAHGYPRATMGGDWNCAFRHSMTSFVINEPQEEPKTWLMWRPWRH